MKGIFLVFEGIDGSGKQTLCTFSRKLLEEHMLKVSQVQYPDYESPWGKIILEFLSGKKELDVSIQFLTYATDIMKDQKKIEEHLRDGFCVLADRYITSTIAFQCSRGFDLNKAIQFVKMFEFVPPDIVFYMNVSPDAGRKRKKGQKGTLDRHEADLKFLEKVNEAYKELQKRKFLAGKWIEIDANEALYRVKAKIESEIKTVLRSLQI